MSICYFMILRPSKLSRRFLLEATHSSKILFRESLTMYKINLCPKNHYHFEIPSKIVNDKIISRKFYIVVFSYREVIKKLRIKNLRIKAKNSYNSSTYLIEIDISKKQLFYKMTNAETKYRVFF